MKFRKFSFYVKQIFWSHLEFHGFVTNRNLELYSSIKVSERYNNYIAKIGNKRNVKKLYIIFQNLKLLLFKAGS